MTYRALKTEKSKIPVHFYLIGRGSRPLLFLFPISTTFLVLLCLLVVLVIRNEMRCCNMATTPTPKIKCPFVSGNCNSDSSIFNPIHNIQFYFLGGCYTQCWCFHCIINHNLFPGTASSDPLTDYAKLRERQDLQWSEVTPFVSCLFKNPTASMKLFVDSLQCYIFCLPTSHLSIMCGFVDKKYKTVFFIVLFSIFSWCLLAWFQWILRDKNI